MFYYAVDHSPSYLWNAATWEISSSLICYLPIIMGGPENWEESKPSGELLRPGLLFVAKTLHCILNITVPHFSGFPMLEEVGQDIFFTGFSEALEITGFNQLHRIGGSFINLGLVSEKISGFENLREVGANFEIRNASGLQSLEGFTALETIGKDFLLIRDLSLKTIPEFKFLKSIGGSLVITDNSFLESLYMDSLETIGADVTIGKRNFDMSLFSAKELVSIAGDFTIGPSNSKLDTFVMPSLESINGSFQFDSSFITRLIGMDNLKEIGGDFIPSTSLFNFENTSIRSIGGDFILDTMKFIRHVDELESLTEIGGDLIISRSPKLEDLGGLGELLSIGGNVLISNNAALAECSGLCTVINGTGISGSLIINSNAAGCNDFAEVEPACAATPTEDLALSKYVSIFPNPVGNELQTETEGIKIDKLVLFDIAGREVPVSTVTTSDFQTMSVKNLSSGVYFLRVSLLSGQRVIKKLVKE